nr:MAG TPA: SEVERIN-BINDING PROTEIN, CALCIUM-BINDING, CYTOSKELETON, GELSOLIN.75A [Bacteriophage sp.]
MNAIQNKPVTYIFDNKAALDGALNLNDDTVTYNEKVCKLNPGDVFLLVSTDEPDYWFGEDSNGEKLHELDARRIELTEYAKTSQFQTMDIDTYNALESKDPNTFYFIVEKEETTENSDGEETTE